MAFSGVADHVSRRNLFVLGGLLDVLHPKMTRQSLIAIPSVSRVK
jgi:hypothetical protein